MVTLMLRSMEMVLSGVYVVDAEIFLFVDIWW